MAGFVPCSDESCLGVIGPDGRCTECGAPGRGGGEDLGGGSDDREPCPDGSCIGVAGPDGLCTECGRRVTGGGPGGPLRSAEVPDPREPCPDGSCIGLLGPDGRCTECGRPAGKDGADEDEEAEADERAETDGAGRTPDDPDDRVPCPDGGCIGIIGADGRCTECGRRPA